MAEYAWIIANIGELVDYARRNQNRDLEMDLLASFFASGLQRSEAAAERMVFRERERRAQALRSNVLEA